MKKIEIIKYGVLHGLGVVLYIIGAAALGIFGFSLTGASSALFVPIIYLLVITLSVTSIASIIFGRPFVWFMRGQKWEAFDLLMYTLSTLLIVITLLLAASSVLQNNDDTYSNPYPVEILD